MSELDLPDLQDVDLKAFQIKAYLNELLATGVPVGISVKTSTRAKPTASYSLEHLAEALFSGAIQSAQLRYGYEGTRWVDTLMRREDAVRLVRMEAP